MVCLAFKEMPPCHIDADRPSVEKSLLASWRALLEKKGVEAIQVSRNIMSLGAKRALLAVSSEESPRGFCEAMIGLRAAHLPNCWILSTPARMHVWWTDSARARDDETPDLSLDASDRLALIEWIASSSMVTREFLDADPSPALQQIYGKSCPAPRTALVALLHLHRPVIIEASQLIFGKDTPVERKLSVSPEVRAFLLMHVVLVYAVRDASTVRRHLIHRWSQYQPDNKKAGLGKYYTQPHLVDLVNALLKRIMASHPTAAIVDLAAGGGAFLVGFPSHRTIGRDIDTDAVALMLEMGFSDVAVANSLAGLDRRKFGLSAEAVLVCTGNPPYNDVSSLNKRSTQAKQVRGDEVDDDLSYKDMGISFMRAYAKLKPVAICVLHPLSYLIKASNFRALRALPTSYRLAEAVVFSSAEFGDNINGKTPFPVVAALYVAGAGMEYEDIRTFPFPLWETQNGKFGPTGSILRLDQVTTIDDGAVRKYPPTKEMPRVSELGLYLYTVRDTNSLLSSGAITEKTDANRVPIQSVDAWKYAYLNCVKRYFGCSFVFGNLSPIYSPADFKEPWFRDACLLDMVMNTQNLPSLRPSLKTSVVITQGWLAVAQRKAGNAALRPPGMPDFYAAFLLFWETGAITSRTILKHWWTAYFDALRSSMLRRT
jgi:hypothetical protein